MSTATKKAATPASPGDAAADLAKEIAAAGGDAQQTYTPEPVRVMARSDAIKLMEFGRNAWHIVAPAEHTLAQVLDLSYCWHRHDQIRPGDKIEIRHALFHYLVEILVVEVDREAQAILGYYTVRDLLSEEMRAPDLSGAFVELLGANKWCVRLGGYVMASNFETQLEAAAWLAKKSARGARR